MQSTLAKWLFSLRQDALSGCRNQPSRTASQVIVAPALPGKVDVLREYLSGNAPG